MTDDNELKMLLEIDELRQRFDRIYNDAYDPDTGYDCVGERVEAHDPEGKRVFIPVEMTEDPEYVHARNNILEWKKLRCYYDFEYWAINCVVIKDKISPRDIPFRLNTPQRSMLQMLEADRRDGLPLRVILLKARQWGGSTLTQMYMAWMQTVRHTNWHSAICAHNKTAAANIRGMFTKLLQKYPKDLWEGEKDAKFVPFEGCTDVRTINGRDCRVSIGSSERPDALRGGDYAMVHLSEAAFLVSTPSRPARALAQAVCSSVPLVPETLVVVESTARGIGDYFHTEWLRSKNGESDKNAIFVPWFEVDFNSIPTDEPMKILANLTPYEKKLWRQGCTSARINWYRRRSREYSDKDALHSEFPSNDIEAFASSQSMVFSPVHVEHLRSACVIPPRKGEIDSSAQRFIDDETGRLKLWEKPTPNSRYVVAVDVGGRSPKSDWSVISVMEADSECPRVCAQWRGHIDHDLLANKSANIARFFNNALLVIESNTYETDDFGSSVDSNLFILNRLAESYPNLYRRVTYDRISNAQTTRIGFHTNRATKTMLISGLIEAVREGMYIERDTDACNELLTYEVSDRGVFSAKQGHNDDILMTRAIALHVIKNREQIPPRLPESFSQQPYW